MAVPAVTMVAALFASQAFAQSARTEEWAMVGSWVDLVERHAVGAADSSVYGMAAVDGRQFERALPLMVLVLERAHSRSGSDGAKAFDKLFRNQYAGVEEIELTREESALVQALVGRLTFPSIRTFLERAAMLHTDVAIHAPQAHQTNVEGSGYLAADGRSRGQVGRSWHWLIARSLLHLALIDWSDVRRPVLDPASDPDVRLWYQAIANYLWSVRDFTEGLPHVERGLELYPGDAELEFVRGLIHESQSGALIQAAVEEQARSVPRVNGMVYTPAVRSAEDERASARDAFRRALEAAPDHLEARLHLAQVLNADEAYGEAAQELALVIAGSSGTWHRYFAYLLLGRAEEGRERLTEARAAYAEAAALFPDAQAPRLALSQLDLRAGDREGALRVFELLSRVRQEQSEPWWRYDSVREPGAEVAWLERLHAAFQASRR